MPYNCYTLFVNKLTLMYVALERLKAALLNHAEYCHILAKSTCDLIAYISLWRYSARFCRRNCWHMIKLIVLILTVRSGVWAWVVWYHWIINDFCWVLSRRDCCWSVQWQVWQENHHVHIWTHRFCRKPAGGFPWSFLAVCAGQMCDWIWNRLVNWSNAA